MPLRLTLAAAALFVLGGGTLAAAAFGAVGASPHRNATNMTGAAVTQWPAQFATTFVSSCETPPNAESAATCTCVLNYMQARLTPAQAELSGNPLVTQVEAGAAQHCLYSASAPKTPAAPATTAGLPNHFQAQAGVNKLTVLNGHSVNDLGSGSFCSIPNYASLATIPMRASVWDCLVGSSASQSGSLTVQATFSNQHWTFKLLVGQGPYRTESAAQQYLQSLTTWHGIPLVTYGIGPLASCSGTGSSTLDSAGESTYRSFSCDLISGSHDFHVTATSITGGFTDWSVVPV